MDKLCLICYEGRQHPPEGIPEHHRYNHYAVTHTPHTIEFEFIIDHRISEEDGKAFSDWLDDSYPWSLEAETLWMEKRGYRIVWMRRQH